MSLVFASRLRATRVASALIAALGHVVFPPLQAAGHLAGAQTSERGTVENTQALINGGIVSINYDLVGPAVQTYEVALEESQNGGRTYELKPKTVSGDVGPGVRPGVGRKIIWEAAKDTDALQLNEYRFRVVAKSEVPPPPPPSSPAPRPEPQRTPASPPTIQRVNTPPPRSRSPLFWPAIGMIGAGVAGSAAAAAGPL